MRAEAARTAALLAGDLAALVLLPPHWTAVADGLRHPKAWTALGHTDVALAEVSGALLWCVGLWLGIGLAAGLGARLPGTAGRLCALGARTLLPRLLLRAVVGTTGLTVLAAPALAVPAVAAVPHAARPAVSAQQPASRAGSDVGIPAPTWPTSPAAPSSVPASTPAPSWPTSAPATPATPPSSATPSPPPPAPPAARQAGPPPSAPSPAPTTAPAPSSTANVRAGDSLWLLAAHRLGSRADDAAVAAYWPQIYAANRDVIGDDPSVIQPGQVLHLPGPTPQELP